MHIICLSEEEVQAAKTLNSNYGKALISLINAETRNDSLVALQACDLASAKASAMFAALVHRSEKAPGFFVRWKKQQESA